MKRRAPKNEMAGEGMVLTVTIGPDGRMFFHDLTAELLPVARALKPGDRDLARRARAASTLKQGAK